MEASHLEDMLQPRNLTDITERGMAPAIQSVLP